MNRRLLGVAGAAALAVIGTFAILAYVRDADDRAQAQRRRHALGRKCLCGLAHGEPPSWGSPGLK